MQDITLGDTSVRVNDGSYHVVRFIRTGANATLQIDDFKTQRKNPLGRQLLVFNTQNQLQIGGKWNPGIGVDRPFIGNLNNKKNSNPQVALRSIFKILPSTFMAI